MLKPTQPIAIYMEGFLDDRHGKMGHAVLRHSPNPVTCVIDSRFAGRDVREIVPVPRSCPVVASVAEAAAARPRPEALLLGIAPSGGRVPPEWLRDLDEAVRLGMSIVNGLHDLLAGRYPHLPAGQWVWDIRREPDGIGVGTGAARGLGNRRVAVLGTDMATGKMTAALELHRAAERRGLRSRFLATGQVGIVISGSGLALDAVRIDYAVGAVEKMVLDAADADVVFLEGQGSILHPGSSATLPLIRGLCPTHLLLCHRAGNPTAGQDWAKIPPLSRVVRLYEDIAECCGMHPRPRTIGVALNTVGLSEAEARQHVARAGAETGLPATDVVRFGCENLMDVLLGGSA